MCNQKPANVTINVEANHDSLMLKLKPTGKLTKEVVTQVANLIETSIKENEDKKINLLVDATAFSGWEYEAFVEDIKLSIKHRNDINKIALFGDQKWLEIAATLASFATSSEVKYFTNNQEAQGWIKH
ncbi:MULTISPECIES: STAS/SEC14 domain-containing protein [Vibrio]|jgi:hypothetical protein|uniref:STAS/SEC14 domain-containing protein n=1 Tax=Vibrio mediterranei TaxID=689 RepID=A0A3G4VGF1_9VIBR|nr:MULTISPECIES: STAS/SEC14 domain-containing protein [Vibrio]AYV23850.1 STAS/SEC14 domain-containing protein [Vibrio mediterranei]EDL54873.1 hypothetical protein VSAK1_19144 [Vibrio mediterranei AK1]KFA95402.1 hypothetical protein HW45_26630 [Vibrio sp. ER1A]MCG9663416.1 STAS/SEC14 domain-containing protein [Vibrio mediterranei]MCG9787934.1 STAS/SEC14 domain-containing protein [Vibrio mediterranei]